MMTSTKRTAQKIVRAGLLALLMLGYASVVPLRAQEPPASPEQKQATGNSAEQPGDPDRQLAHESRDAAGEEKDEMAEFKQSASVREIAKLTGLNLQQAYWLSVVLNFVVIAAAIVWASRKCSATAAPPFRRRCRKPRSPAKKPAAGWLTLSCA